MPINGLVYFLWVVLGIRIYIYIYIFFFWWERISYILLYNTYKKYFCIRKKITIISPMHSIIIYFFLRRAMNDAQYFMTYFSLKSYSRVEVSCLTVSGKKKNRRSVEEVSWKSLTWMVKHQWVHHCPWQSPKPKYAKLISAFCFLTLTSFVLHFFSLSLSLSLSLSQIIELEEDEPKLFTKTNKNQYIKTIFLARQKAYKNIY